MKIQNKSISKSNLSKEKLGVDLPLLSHIISGDLEGWKDAKCIIEFCPNFMVKGGAKLKNVDILLISPESGFALIECKHSSSPQAKCGMIEQIMLYGIMFDQLIQPANDTKFRERFKNVFLVEKVNQDSIVYRKTDLSEYVKTIKKDFSLFLALDRWDKSLKESTVHIYNRSGLTLQFLNPILANSKIGSIRLLTVQDNQLREISQFRKPIGKQISDT